VGAAYCKGIGGIGGASQVGIGGRAVAFRSSTERAEKVACDFSGRAGDLYPKSKSVWRSCSVWSDCVEVLRKIPDGKMGSM
jgi:hypothetical protein